MRPSLGQLRQRISVLSKLDPLPLHEVEQFIDYRLRVAGYAGGPLFTPQARRMIAQLSDGIPRNINNLCFNALSIGCALQQKTIDVDILAEVAGDFDLSKLISEPAQNQYQPMVGKINAVSFNPGNADPLPTPADAVAYMREIIHLLNKRQRLDN